MICIFFPFQAVDLVKWIASKSDPSQGGKPTWSTRGQSFGAHTAKVFLPKKKHKNRWSTTDGSKLSDSHKIVTIFSDCHKIVTRWVEVSDSHELSPYCPQVVSSTRLSSIAVVISNIKGGPVKKHPVCMHRVSQNMCMYVCVCIQSSPNQNLSFIRTFCRSRE